MNLETRLQRLETQFTSDPIILWLEDGSTRQIHYSGNRVLDLFMTALSGEDTHPEMTKHLDWIRLTVRHYEPDGGHMMELIRAVLNAPPGLAHRPADRLRPPELGPIPTRPQNWGGRD